MRTRFAATAALTVVAAIGAGCGSSDDKGTSKADFVKQADAICAKGDKQINAAAKRDFTSKKKPGQAEVVKFVKGEVLPSLRTQIDGIKKLDTPKGDQDQVKAITDAADAAVPKIEANPKLAAANGKKNPFAKANKLARGYGLKKCGASG